VNPPLSNNQRKYIQKATVMKRLFSPNIGKPGRLMRGGIALLLFLSAGLAFTVSFWMGLALVASGGFVLFEALRGWCALRACGIKTRL
jgi:hypothetical protein